MTDEKNYEEDDVMCALDEARSLHSTDGAADSDVEGASTLSLFSPFFLGRWARTLAEKHRSKYFDGSPSSRSAIQHLTNRCDRESGNMTTQEERAPLRSPEGAGLSNSGLVGRKEVELGEVERRRGGDRYSNRRDGSDIADETTTRNPLHSAVAAMTGAGGDGDAPATGHMVDMDELAFLTASSGTLL